MAGGKKPGTLHLVATPIGNLEDLSRRASRTLEECDLIAAEDTRRTRKLLTHYGISRPLVSYYEQATRDDTALADVVTTAQRWTYAYDVRGRALIWREVTDKNNAEYNVGGVSVPAGALAETAISAGDNAPRSKPSGAWMRASSTAEKPASVSRCKRLAWVLRLPRAPM